MISIIVTLVIVGVLLYILGLIPLDGTIKTIIRVLVILFAFLWVLQVLGVWSGFPRALR